MSKEPSKSGKHKRRRKNTSGPSTRSRAKDRKARKVKRKAPDLPPDAEPVDPEEPPRPEQRDLFELAEERAETEAEAAESEPPRRKSILKRRRRDEEVVARALGGAAETRPAREPERQPEIADTSEPADDSPAPATETKPADEPTDQPAKALAAELTTEKAEAPEPEKAEPAPAEPARGAPPSEKPTEPSADRTPGRVLLSVFLGLVRVAVTAGLVIGIIGATSYLVMQAYVGGKEVEVPVLLGSTLDEALEKLRPSRLYLELDAPEGRIYSDEVPRGRIVGQFPAPHTTVKARTPVKIVLSDGPELKRTPPLVGLSEIVAGVTLRKEVDADLNVGDRSFVHWPGSKKGEVIGQDPPAGTPIRRDGRIDLLISLGPPPVLYTMPDLTHMTIDEARIALGAMHLTITDVREIDRPGYQRRSVVTQEPLPGHRVSPTMPIIITIATGVGGAP